MANDLDEKMAGSRRSQPARDLDTSPPNGPVEWPSIDLGAFLSPPDA